MPTDPATDTLDAPVSSADFEVLITAEQAWPAFERAVLSARSEISMGFRIFDLATRLRSPEGLAVGTDWFDLLAHKLAQGVSVRLVVSDFDPVMGAELHDLSLGTCRQGAALRELVGPVADLRVLRALHPARDGALWRVVLGPLARRHKGGVPPFHTVTHHQKLAVIDRELLYIGGLDLNERRFDTLDHERAADATWTDVQVLVRGPEAVEAAEHLAHFLVQTGGQTGGHTGGPSTPRPLTHLRRTISAPRKTQAFYLAPRTVLREIEADHLAAIQDARQLIHIETQFLRSGRIAKALARAAMVQPDLRLILVLPALPDDVAFEDNRGFDARYGLWLSARALKRVSEAFGPRAAFLSPVLPERAARGADHTLAGSPVIYVHSKTLIVDDTFAMVGSANLNGRSLRWDTEAALAITDAARIAALREGLTAHWWGTDVPAEALDPGRAQRWWQAEAQRNAVRRPEARRGFLVPHDANKVPELHAPMPGVTEDIV